MRPSPVFTHEQALLRLKAMGVAPRVIYDIGAFHGGWTHSARKVFSAADYFLFEANPDNALKLKETGEKFFMAALSAQDGAAGEFYLPKNATATGASLYREKTHHYEGDNVRVIPVTTRRLDALAAEHKLPAPDLIKLDVQGAELDVLAGAGALLSGTNAIIAELSFLSYNEAAPLIAAVNSSIDRLGFKCADLCEVHKSASGSVLQADVLFANPALFQKYRVAAHIS
jgi:FkbM family methyltransferase